MSSIQRMVFSNFQIIVNSNQESEETREHGRIIRGRYTLSAPVDGARLAILDITITPSKVMVRTKIRKSNHPQGRSMQVRPLEMPDIVRALHEYYLIGRRTDLPQGSRLQLHGTRAVKCCSWLEHDYSFSRRG